LLTDVSTHIGGYAMIPKSKDDWIWQNSGNPVFYKMNFHDGEPNYHDNDERCLSILRKSVFALNDEDCSDEHRFICQLEVGQVEPEEGIDQSDGVSMTESNLKDCGVTELSRPTPKPKDPEDGLKVRGFIRIGNYGKLVKLIMVQILQS